MDKLSDSGDSSEGEVEASKARSGEKKSQGSEEVEALRIACQSLEAVDTGLQAILEDMKTISKEYERATRVTLGWAEIMGIPIAKS